MPLIAAAPGAHSPVAIVAGQFLAGLWKDQVGELKPKAAAGILLNKLLRFRQGDWFVWIVLLLFIPADGFVRYAVGINDWTCGQEVSLQPTLDRWEPQLVRPGIRLADHVSAIAMHVAGVI